MSVILEELGTVTQHNFYREHSPFFFPYPNFRLLTSTTETHEPQSNSMRVIQADLRDHQWPSGRFKDVYAGCTRPRELFGRIAH